MDLMEDNCKVASPARTVWLTAWYPCHWRSLHMVQQNWSRIQSYSSVRAMLWLRCWCDRSHLLLPRCYFAHTGGPQRGSPDGITGTLIAEFEKVSPVCQLNSSQCIVSRYLPRICKLRVDQESTIVDTTRCV